MHIRGWSCGLFCALLFCGLLPAQQADSRAALLARIERLEKELTELKAQVLAPVAAAQPEPVPEPASQSPAGPEAAGVPLAPPADAGPRRFISFRALADVMYSAQEGGNKNNRFTLGELDLFTTARLAPHLTALVEGVVKAQSSGVGTDAAVSLERLLLRYRPSDYFNVDAGAFQTAIGFYSTAYLRGAWFQTAVTRPRIFAFEADGGFLPLHNVGLSFTGAVPSGALGLRYVVETGNSRNYGSAQPFFGASTSSGGAWNLAVQSRPAPIPGLRVGFSHYRDELTTAKSPTLRRRVWTAHAVYQANRVEFLNEGVYLTLSNPAEVEGTVPSFYTQFAYRVASNWRPYARFEWANAAFRGEIRDTVSQASWRRIHSLGMRYDFTDTVALKVEAARETDRDRQNKWSGSAQLAFTF